MIIWKLLFLIVGALAIIIGIIERIDLMVLPLPLSFKQSTKLRSLYYSLIGVGIGMLVGGIMLC